MRFHFPILLAISSSVAGAGHRPQLPAAQQVCDDPALRQSCSTADVLYQPSCARAGRGHATMGTLSAAPSTHVVPLCSN